MGSHSQPPSSAHSAGVPPPGMVALTVGELGRYHAFTIALSSLQLPPGSIINMVQSLSVAANLNMMVKQMLDEAPQLMWFNCQADDHVFRPDFIYAMCEGMYAEDVQVVVPLITRRRPPFSTIIFKEETADGFVPYAWDELPPSGLFGPLYAAGTGGMMIRRETLERMREWQGHERWFEFSAGEVVNEDTEFCAKLRQLGVPIYANLDVQMGHATMMVTWPLLNGDEENPRWGINFQMGDGPEGVLKGVFLQPGERVPE